MESIAIIGFGEAGQAFAGAIASFVVVRAFDVTDRRAACTRAGVVCARNAAEALTEASAALSVVTADQALDAARTAAPHLGGGALWLDMNSVAPATKRAAAAAVEARGGRYVDVAVMAPVQPGGLSVPLLVAGPHAAEATDTLAHLGFRQVRVVEGEVGRASAIKLVRSVMIKGTEALIAECLLAAHAAGVLPDVLASLDADRAAARWPARADYALDRMMVHGTRRAAEMAEAAATLESFGVEPVMTRGTVERQRRIGGVGTGSPAGLAAKLAALASGAEAL